MNSKIEDVSCGDNHTIAITSSGDVYSWGQGNNGTLGVGQVNYRQKPILIEEL